MDVGDLDRRDQLYILYSKSEIRRFMGFCIIMLFFHNVTLLEQERWINNFRYFMLK